MKRLAKAALDVYDVTIPRRYEHAVAVPSEWATYRGAVQAIVSGVSVVTEMPWRLRIPPERSQTS
jgi:hypothetical protein